MNPATKTDADDVLLSDVKIVYVNCDKSRDRDERMQDQLEKAALVNKAQRLSCCTSNGLTDEEKRHADKCGLQHVELAIAKSHLKAIREFVHDYDNYDDGDNDVSASSSSPKKEYLLVFEDDIVLEDRFAQKVSFLLDLVARGAGGERFASLYLSDNNFFFSDYTKDRQASYLIQDENATEMGIEEGVVDEDGDRSVSSSNSVVLYKINAPHCAGMAAYIFSIHYCRCLLKIVANHEVTDPIDLYIQLVHFEEGCSAGAHYTLRPRFLRSGYARNWTTTTPIPTKQNSSRLVEEDVRVFVFNIETLFYIIRRALFFVLHAHFLEMIATDSTRTMCVNYILCNIMHLDFLLSK